MNKGKYFWGLFFISLGVLILNQIFNFIDINYLKILKIYPIFLVLIGLSFISYNRAFLKFIYSLWGIFLALYVFAFVMWLFDFNFKVDYDQNTNYHTKSFKINEDIQLGNFTLNLSAANIELTSIKENYIKIRTDSESNQNDEILTIDRKNNTVFFTFNDKRFRINRNYQTDFEISNKILWDFDWNINFSNVTFYPKHLNFSNFDLKSNFSNVKLYLTQSNITNQRINIVSNFSNIKIFVPKNMLCLVNGSNILVDFENNTDVELDQTQSLVDTLKFNIKGFASNIKIFNN